MQGAFFVLLPIAASLALLDQRVQLYRNSATRKRIALDTEVLDYFQSLPLRPSGVSSSVKPEVKLIPRRSTFQPKQNLWFGQWLSQIPKKESLETGHLQELSSDNEYEEILDTGSPIDDAQDYYYDSAFERNSQLDLVDVSKPVEAYLQPIYPFSSDKEIQYRLHDPVKDMLKLAEKLASSRDWVLIPRESLSPWLSRDRNRTVALQEDNQRLPNGSSQNSISKSENGLNRKLSESKSHPRGTRSVQTPGMKPNSCHSEHLHKCGTTVIQEFNVDPDSPKKCKIREKFLDCMVQQRERGCPATKDTLYSEEDTNSIRSQVKHLLWSANGCLLF